MKVPYLILLLAALTGPLALADMYDEIQAELQPKPEPPPRERPIKHHHFYKKNVEPPVAVKPVEEKPLKVEEMLQSIGQLRSKEGFCTGTLISADVVLTAAHCVFSARPEELHFTLDRHPNWGSKAKFARVREIRVHPDYGTFPLGPNPGQQQAVADLALLFLADAEYGWVPTYFLPLVAGRTVDAGIPMLAPGYGLNPDGSHSQFRGIATTVSKVTESRDKAGKPVEEGLIYTAPDTRTGVACVGDSGGPLLARRGQSYEIVGVASQAVVRQNHAACGSLIAEVFSSTYPYRAWIASQKPKGISFPILGLSD